MISIAYKKVSNMQSQSSLVNSIKGLVPKPLRKTVIFLLMRYHDTAKIVSGIPKSLRKRKLVRAKRIGYPLLAKVPATHCLMLLEPSHFITNSWFVNGDFEPGVIRIMRRLVKPGMTCIDLGANAGYFTLFLSKVVGNRGTIYAFEPTKNTYTRLRNNLGLNRADNVVAEELAISSYCGEILFHEGPSGYDVYNTSGKLVPQLDTVAAQFTNRNIAAVTLDKYCSTHGIRNVNFIKIDIEGGELAALKGAEQIITNSPRLSMVIEVSPELAVSSGYKTADLLGWLTDRGFDLFLIQNSGRLIAVTDPSVTGMVVAMR